MRHCVHSSLMSTMHPVRAEAPQEGGDASLVKYPVVVGLELGGD